MKTKREIWEDRRERWNAFNEGKSDRLANRPSRIGKYERFSAGNKAYNEGWSKGEEMIAYTYQLGREDYKRGEPCPTHYSTRAAGWKAEQQAAVHRGEGL